MGQNIFASYYEKHTLSSTALVLKGGNWVSRRPLAISVDSFGCRDCDEGREWLQHLMGSSQGCC